MVAGPIERASNLLPQINLDKKKIDTDAIIAGFLQFIYGLFKKVVVADTAALYVDSIYNNYEYHGGLTLTLATIFFAIQIYADFSGYSDMAIGCARMLGFKLMDNFHLPFFSKSMTEMWRRWHISLGNWANDYMFKSFSPYWVRKFGKNGIFISLLITFTLIGLWHGARWTYILFGVFQGLILGIEFLSKKRRNKLKKRIGKPLFKYAGWFITMFLWFISMVLFRSIDLTQILFILKKIFTLSIFEGFRIQDTSVFANLLIGTFVLMLLDYGVFRKHTFFGIVKKSNLQLVSSFSAFLILLIVLFGVSEGSQFIYFQF